ncbi:COP9 signalosome complex subunit 5 [Salpingoeca rosetta]|uniref:COP9 signalosome complex subunit 5 n=1 Tax=Salpingoeca rosetta (strain ATCC 50818 / BSB-021) TaxID=946362 RepID=F2UFT2_SALR5|nr:COP9 signalosome complex subunit 5 [Salpingoeca rosetta]EGD75360.1 COP9 signalosome complex subunit 5 [Salpingoeca rosetta]|eukprot:XP_004991817.1 COP9 signalosome complex subunit 5 [Salpingoeca rosetta]
MADEEAAALAKFEDANDIAVVDDADQVYAYDADKQREEMRAEPWLSNPSYFTKVRISAVALIKMVTHAKTGGRLEVMGILQGKVDGDTLIVMDAFALPVQGTETRVNAGQAEYAFMVQYADLGSKIGRYENVLGWYHSHPGYGCWLSGIDVATQLMNQQHQDPWLAIVVDPVRTQVAGKVELGAFRCYPKGHEPSKTSDASEYQSIPLDKIEDFGVHANSYYPGGVVLSVQP